MTSARCKYGQPLPLGSRSWPFRVERSTGVVQRVTALNPEVRLFSFLLSLVVATVAALVPTFSLAAPSPTQKCEAALETATAKFAQCRLNAEAKFTKDGDTGKRTASLERCSSRLSSAFVKTTAVYGAACPASEPVGEFDAFLAQCTDQVASAAGGGQFASCGDGVVNRAGEQCDGSDFGGETCAALGFVSGTLGCDSRCTFDLTGCERAAVVSCGPGTFLDPDEKCAPQQLLLDSPESPPGYTFADDLTHWRLLPALPTARIIPTLASLNGKLYVIGGYQNGAPLSVVEVYDPATKSWSTRAPLLIPRFYAAAAELNGKIYIAGGDSPQGLLNEVEVYDPLTDTWTSVAPMSLGRRLLALVALNGKLYALGGDFQGNPYVTATNSVEAYDPVANVWTPKAPMPVLKSTFGAARLGNTIVTVGGATTTQRLASVDSFDPVSNLWTALPPMPTARDRTAAVVLDGKLLVMGGDIDTTPFVTSVVEAYDPASTTWTTFRPMLELREFLGAASIGSRIYAGGGYTSDPARTLEEFIPAYLHVH